MTENTYLKAENEKLKNTIRKIKQDKNKASNNSPDVKIDGIKFIKSDRDKEYSDFYDFYTLEKKVLITFKTSLGVENDREEQIMFLEWFFDNQKIKEYFSGLNVKFKDIYLKGNNYYFTVSCMADVIDRHFPTL